jgi:hypothetical protein
MIHRLGLDWVVSAIRVITTTYDEVRGSIPRRAPILFLLVLLGLASVASVFS